MKTATRVKDVSERFTGSAVLFLLDPPLADEPWNDEDEVVPHEYVVVSSAIAPYSGPETYIFPADSEGNVTAWGELPGSQRGIMDPKAALESAGYTVVANITTEE